MDPLCQHSTEEHMHPWSGHFNHPYVPHIFWSYCKDFFLVLRKSGKMNGKSGENRLGAVFRVLGSDLIIENALKMAKKSGNMY